MIKTLDKINKMHYYLIIRLILRPKRTVIRMAENEDGDKKEKPSWLDLANLAINFGLFVVALLALILK